MQIRDGASQSRVEPAESRGAPAVSHLHIEILREQIFLKVPAATYPRSRAPRAAPLFPAHAPFFRLIPLSRPTHRVVSLPRFAYKIAHDALHGYGTFLLTLPFTLSGAADPLSVSLRRSLCAAARIFLGSSPLLKRNDRGYRVT